MSKATTTNTHGPIDARRTRSESIHSQSTVHKRNHHRATASKTTNSNSRIQRRSSKSDRSSGSSKQSSSSRRSRRSHRQQQKRQRQLEIAAAQAAATEMFCPVPFFNPPLEEEYSTTKKRASRSADFSPQEYLSYRGEESSLQTPERSFPDEGSHDAKELPPTPQTEALTPETSAPSSESSVSSHRSLAASVGSNNQNPITTTQKRSPVRPRALLFEESMKKIEDEKRQAAETASQEEASSDVRATENESGGDDEEEETYEEAFISPLKFVLLAIVIALLGPSVDLAIDNHFGIERSSGAAIETHIQVETQIDVVEPEKIDVVEHEIEVEEIVVEPEVEVEEIAEDPEVEAEEIAVEDIEEDIKEDIEEEDEEEDEEIAVEDIEEEVFEDTVEDDEADTAETSPTKPISTGSGPQMVEALSLSNRIAPRQGITGVKVSSALRAAVSQNEDVVVPPDVAKVQFFPVLAALQHTAMHKLEDLAVKAGENREWRSQQRDVWRKQEEERRRSRRR